jgi:LPLT family lysophospholipid transporter-like MFS transporter
MAAQAIAAFADAVLLLLAIVAVRSEADGNAAAGVVQQLYVLPFLVFAPFAGAVANARPKRQVMIFACAVKFLAAAGLALGASPWAMMGCAGFGAVLYSPAKYGTLVELFEERRLVMANAIMEGSAVMMLVSGTVAAGFLADVSPRVGLQVVLCAYAVSALLMRLVPRAALCRNNDWLDFGLILRGFRQAAVTLFAQAGSRLSLMGTSLLLSSATTLRLLILAWVPVALGVHDNGTPTLLMGMAAIGMIAGAITAGRLIKLENVKVVLIPGFMMGSLIVALTLTQTALSAACVAFAIGACAGTCLVPLNAALQRAGAATVGTGLALAVQNFCENIATVAMVGCYSAVSRAGMPVQSILTWFGFAVAAVMLLAMWQRRENSDRNAAAGN